MLYKRARILINRKFQLKFAFFVCSWIFALSMIYPIIIYNIFEYFLRIFTSGEHMTMGIDKVKVIENQILMVLGVVQLLFLGVTFILTIFLSHRIAGPVYKLRRALEEVGSGNFDQRLTFRKNDHFGELQDTFNDMIQHLSVRKWKDK